MTKAAPRPPRVRTSLKVTVTDARGRPTAGHGLAPWLASAAPARARGAVGIALVSDATMRRLNREFRGQNHATDVLSFPFRLGNDREPRSGQAPRPKPHASSLDPLGDLAIATGVAARQAREQGHSLRTELRILALHGLLHLLGYDHEVDGGEMRRVEDRLRRRAGLPLGLIARAPVRPKR